MEIPEDFDNYYKEMYKDYLDLKNFENIRFNDAIKPVFKNTFVNLGKSFIAFKLTYDVLSNLQKSYIYKNYTVKEKITVNKLLKLCQYVLKFFSNVLCDIEVCFQIPLTNTKKS